MRGAVGGDAAGEGFPGRFGEGGEPSEDPSVAAAEVAKSSARVMLGVTRAGDE
ncbi:hypothetical protein GCM10010282_30510 [Streptomyces roseolus]|nr:hypothetical protein GCM10010282_30510 [Streptomyces roseolus]